jgi:beta-glucosidase
MRPPWVTLDCRDLPQALYEEYRGILDKDWYTADFMRYARLCFERFAHRVKRWITYNGHGLTARAGYAQGRNAPGHASDTEPWIVGHTELVSHGYMCEMYKGDFQPTQKVAL